MTKDELLKLNYEGNLTNRELENFFSSNVVIPRGDNRHPNSEELHKAIEDSSIILECSNMLNPWEEVSSFHKFTFRIKPSEPVWEYQWVVIGTDNINRLSEYMTEDYRFNYYKATKAKWVKIEETKRVRA